MATDWSPEQRAADRAHQHALRRDLAQIRQALASWHAAEHLDEPAAVCNALAWQFWQLVFALDAQDARLAVLMLLSPDAVQDAHRMLTVPDDASTLGWWQ